MHNSKPTSTVAPNHHQTTTPDPNPITSSLKRNIQELTETSVSPIASIILSSEQTHNDRVARWLHSQFYIVNHIHFFLDKLHPLHALRSNAIISWFRQPTETQQIFLTLAKLVREHQFYRAPNSQPLMPIADRSVWRSRHLHTRQTIYPSPHPIHQIDEYLESIHEPILQVELTLQTLEILDHKRFHSQVIEHNINTLGLRFTLANDEWNLQVRNPNDNTFAVESFFLKEIQTCMSLLRKLNTD